MSAASPDDDLPSAQGVAMSAPRRRWLATALTLALMVALTGGAYYLVQRAIAPAGGGARMPGMGGPGGFGGGPGGFGGAGGVTVGQAQALQGELPVLIDALGTVTPPVTATLAPQISGLLEEVLFTEGQMVQKGQVLARIDARPYQQALAQARGQRAKNEAQLAAARVTLQRYQTLWQQDSIAKQELDSQAALVQQLQGTLVSDRANEQAAQINLGHASLRAPITGRIGLRAVDAGNLVSAGSAGSIATITQITPIDVVFAVPQDRVPAVLAAQGSGRLPVTAMDRGRSQILGEGQFLTLDNQINTATGTVRAKARFANADGALFPNQFVNVRLQLGTTPGVLVPVMALRTGPQGDYLYVIDDERTAHMRSVSRGLATAEQVLITKGLQAGERVVTEGGDRVKDGGKVQLAADRPGAGAPSARSKSAISGVDSAPPAIHSGAKSAPQKGRQGP